MTGRDMRGDRALAFRSLRRRGVPALEAWGYARMWAAEVESGRDYGSDKWFWDAVARGLRYTARATR